jgi:hypothetical protein
MAPLVLPVVTKELINGNDAIVACLTVPVPAPMVTVIAPTGVVVTEV